MGNVWVGLDFLMVLRERLHQGFGPRGGRGRMGREAGVPAGLWPECRALPQALTFSPSEEMQQTFKYFQTKQDTLKDSPPVAPSSASGRI